MTPSALKAWLESAGLRLACPVALGYSLPSRQETGSFGQDIAVIERAR